MVDAPVVICALEHERKPLVRALRGRARLVVCGPGAVAAERAVGLVAAQDPRPSLLVLFGLAGGLRDCERAPRVGWVMDRDARRWSARCAPPGTDDPVGVLGLDEPVTQPARKRRMGQAYGATLVDMESHGFARACEAAALRWAVVRAVSDGPDHALPEAALSWVDSRGKTRPAAAVAGMLLNPGALVGAIGMWRRARPALRDARAQLLALLDAHARAPASVEVRAAPTLTPVSGLGSRPATPTNPIEAQLGRPDAPASLPRRPRA